MAEIPALTAARSFALQTDAQRAREQQDQLRARVEAQRQEALDTQNRDARVQREADRQRLAGQRADIRTRDDNLLQRAAGDQADNNRRIDIGLQRTRTDARASDLLAADQATVDRQLELDRNAFATRPAELPQPQDTGRVARPDNAAPAPAADNTAPAGAAPSPDQLREAAFQAQLAERDQRVAERRADERNAAIQQQIDLQLSGDRIDATLFNPDLPRGSVVDVSG